MADLSAATQSPSVSSSSSGAEPSVPGGGGSPGACPALGAKSCGSSCADSFVSSSSSQPVSLFSTSQEGASSLCSGEPPSEIRISSFSSSEMCNIDLATLHGEQSKVLGSQPASVPEGRGEDGLSLLEVTALGEPRGSGGGGASAPVSVAGEGPCKRPSIPSSFPGHSAFLPKEAVQMGEQINKGQESRNSSELPRRDDKTALDADDKFVLLTARKPPSGHAKAEGACANSLSPSRVSGGGVIEEDSPESPFEVIIDKAAFDKEFTDAYKGSTNDLWGWAARSDRESPADTAESNDRVLPLRSEEAGRYPASALLARQFSQTTAALEEVSRCVSDMHHFTNEVLTWDLVPQVKQRSDESDDLTETPELGMSECHAEIPVVSLKTNTHQKIPVCSINGAAPVTKPTGLPREKAVIEEPTPDCLDTRTDTEIQGVRGSVRKQGPPLPESPGSPSEKRVPAGPGAAPVKVALPDGRPEAEMSWPSSVSGGGAEADSSGESDDTVIEDVTADTALESHRVQAGKPVSIPSAAVNADGREIKGIPHFNRETGTSQHLEGVVGDPEPQVQPDWLEAGAAGAAARSQGPALRSLSGDGEPSARLRGIIPGKAAAAEDPNLPVAASSEVFSETEFSPAATASAYLESLNEESSKDIDDSSPEDLIAALTHTGENRAVAEGEGTAFGAASEKAADFKAARPDQVLRAGESGGPEIKDTDSKRPGQGQHRETSGSAPLGAFPAPGASAAAPDLEQEQLTVRALRELRARRAGAPAPAPAARPPPSRGVPEHAEAEADVEAGSDTGLSRKPAVTAEATSVDFIPSLSKTALVNEHVLARLLADLAVHDLIFWRDVKKTGFVFGTTLIVLLSLAAFSVISVVSYLILALLSVTISFRVYRSVIQAVQKSEEGHPFKAYLDADIALSAEAFHNYVNAALAHVNGALKLVARLFLVEDLVDSLKLAVFMWLMTYVGAVFNGITLLILAELLVFSVPVVYEKYKTQIDHYVGIVRDQTKSIVEKIQAKLPGIAKKKAE